MNAERIIADNLATVRGKIAESARRSGRTAGDVSLVAVTKYVSAEIAMHLVSAGCNDLGESRPQELWNKAETLSQSIVDGQAIRWHMIGHLQRNKAPRTAPLISLLHSGDSVRVLEALNQSAAGLNLSIPALIEVNISGDSTKHGFKLTEIETALPAIAAMSSLNIRGLMCMASREGDLSQARREFSALRELRDRLRKTAPPNITLNELSMGMSGDYEIAIEEGATIVRIGSALFEGIAARD